MPGAVDSPMASVPISDQRDGLQQGESLGVDEGSVAEVMSGGGPVVDDELLTAISQEVADDLAGEIEAGSSNDSCSRGGSLRRSQSQGMADSLASVIKVLGCEEELGVASGGCVDVGGANRCPSVAITDVLCTYSDSLSISHLSSSLIADAAGGRKKVIGDLQTLDIAKSRADSFLPRLNDVVGHCGGGTVREEDRVLRVTRGALRPQPADGLWQPLSSPVEPVSVVEGGVGQDGRSGGRSYAHVVQSFCFVSAVELLSTIVTFKRFSVGGLASPASSRCRSTFVGSNLTVPRRRRSFMEDCGCALRAVNPGMVFMFESEQHREHRVRAVVERSLTEELSPHQDKLRLDLDAEAEEIHASGEIRQDLVPIVEGVTEILELPQPDFILAVDGGASGVGMGSLPMPGAVDSPMASVPISDQGDGLQQGESLGVDEGSVAEVVSGGGPVVDEELLTAISQEVAYDLAGGADRCPSVAITDVLCTYSDSLSISHLSSSLVADAAGDSFLPMLNDVVGHCGGGTVREEDRVLPMTRGALRPQPADGLRQPLSSLVELVSVVEGGVGQDGHSGGRSYAHVVEVC
ncbi:hypothetical protein Dimus_013547 [Dionaea muscipula]